MEYIIILAGMFITLASLLFIFMAKPSKKNDFSSKRNITDLELEYLDLKNNIAELTQEFNRSASFNTNMLDEKITYLSEMRNDLDEKILKVTKLMTDMEIMFNRLKKLENNIPNLKEKIKQEEELIQEAVLKEDKVIKMKPKLEKVEDDLETQIIEYYKKGLSIKEISSKTGKSLGEIEFIMGLQKSK